MRALPRSRFVLALLLGLAAGMAQAVTVEQIPSPRPTGWAVDLTGTLPPEKLAELNQLGDQIKETMGAEMVVVVVGSTDGVDSHEFATRLFNAWRIGDNGLLIFAALADHRTEIVLGHVLDGETGRRVSAAVMQGEMVPRFRAGNPAGAIVMGAIGCARRILGVSPINTGLEMVPETTSYAPAETPAPAVPDATQAEPVPGPSAQTSSQAPIYVYPEEPRHGVMGFLVFGVLVLLIVGLTAFRVYSQGGGMGTGDSWANRSYDDDRYNRSWERQEERTTTPPSAAAALGSFSSGGSSSSSPSSGSSSRPSSGSGSSSGFSGGSSSGGGASGSW